MSGVFIKHTVNFDINALFVITVEHILRMPPL